MSRHHDIDLDDFADQVRPISGEKRSYRTRRRKGRDVTCCLSTQRLSKQVGGMLLLKQALPATEQLASHILALPICTLSC
jgi:hypothetical protein